MGGDLMFYFTTNAIKLVSESKRDFIYGDTA